jgi:4-hydroxy-2-oxoheptanedioate aldolase
MPKPILDILPQMVRSRQAIYSAWIGTPAPAVIEALMREAFDTAVLDMQHGGFDESGTFAGIASAALLGKPAIVRIPVGGFAAASRMLDAGAAGIIAPMINSVEDARAFAAFTKFPPVGQRSWGPRRATMLSGRAGPAYLEAANGQHLTIAMIETREALAALDGILTVPGIDGVFVGPSDLSIALSEGTTIDPASGAVDAALGTVQRQAAAAGKFAGLFCFGGASAKAMAARGFGLMSIATDLLLLGAAARQEVAAARAE